MSNHPGNTGEIGMSSHRDQDLSHPSQGTQEPASVSTAEASGVRIAEEERPLFQWRVCWHSGYVGTDGNSGWEDWEGPEETAAEVSEAINAEGAGPVRSASIAEETFWSLSGTEYWAEIREAASESADDE